LTDIAQAKTDFNDKNWLNYGFDIGNVFGIFFYGDVSTKNLNRMPTDAVVLAQVASGLENSLKNEDMGAYRANLSYLNQKSLLEIITKYVESGHLVDTQSLFQEKQYVEFGEKLGDFIKFSFKIAEKNHKEAAEMGFLNI